MSDHPQYTPNRLRALGETARREGDANARCERLQHRRGVVRPGAVVEGQHHFLVGEEVELLEMLETEARSARGVDHDGAGDAERIGIGAS